MFKNILSTFASKLLTTFFLFVLVLLTTNYLGAEGRGIISLITASIGIINLVNGFIGGSAVVYLWPKYRSKIFYKNILLLSLLWAILTGIITSFILYLFQSFSFEYLYYVIFLSITSSITFSFSMLLIGDGRINNYNMLNLLQSFLNIVFLSFALFILKESSITAYLWSVGLASLITLVLSMRYLVLMVIPKEVDNDTPNIIFIIKEIVKYGFLNQLGNLISFFNYRLSYFILYSYIGKAVVGKYSVGVQIAESIWLIASSIALVQYSKIASSKNEDESIDITIKLSKFSLVITICFVSFLLIIPSGLFTIIFGKDFTEIKTIIFILSPGIIFHSFNVIIAHYFAGKGMYIINTIGATISLIITLGGNYLTVSKYGFFGAGLTSSFAYMSLFIFYLILFLNKSNKHLKDFLPSKDDLLFIRQKLFKY